MQYTLSYCSFTVLPSTEGLFHRNLRSIHNQPPGSPGNNTDIYSQNKLQTYRIPCSTPSAVPGRPAPTNRIMHCRSNFQISCRHRHPHLPGLSYGKSHNCSLPVSDFLYFLPAEIPLFRAERVSTGDPLRLSLIHISPLL